jgi:Na+-driven multidrug efflux pump
MVVIQIPLAYVLAHYSGLGITGIWIAVIVGIIIQAVLLTLMYRRGTWKHITLKIPTVS